MKSELQPRALLIDLDGTLADSLEVMYTTYAYFLMENHKNPSRHEFQSLNGPPLKKIIQKLKNDHNLPQEEACLYSSYLKILELSYSQVPPNRGALELLQKAKSEQCCIGVVTSNTSEQAIKWLRQANFDQYIDFVVGSQEVKDGKPHPEPYLTAIKLTKCPAQDIVAIEDSYPGVQAAVTANLRTLVLDSECLQTWPMGATPIDSLYEARKQLWPATP